ncbi:ATP-binding protein [Microscilla marina]|uniref:histidine kinase n=1 Tax=Microscilla marina ATCC 23134 TaxID=313606 RepID=A1ZFS3_MICM2|nr:ATP-binding protein [Microscilla marina]EAY30847.1 two-component sensor histidine kinase [Microscilla marina ATCC 23134]
MSKVISVADLSQLATFAHIPDHQLQWLIDHSTVVELPDGGEFFKKGDPIEHTHFILEGKISFRAEQAGQFREVAQASKGEVSGILPFSRGTTANGFGITSKNTTIMSLPKEFFKEMIRDHYELTEMLVHTMTNRVRSFTKQQEQNGRMIALGKISAGLAHELNNPASAVVRSAAELKRQLQLQPDNFKKVMCIRMKSAQVDAVNDLLFAKAGAGPRTDMSLMEKTDLEDELTDWLEEHGIDDGSEIAETLAEFNCDIDMLEQMYVHVPDEHFPPVANWIRSVLSTEKLVTEIEEASSRIAKLVTSVKSYTHMDQAPEQQMADVREGIRNTLTILGHKIKKQQIALKENFPKGMPQVKVFVSELNQVWTNLMDNAIDAMPEGGTLEIAADFDDDYLRVYIIDNGTGIPEDVLGKIFDPFFTTKAMGKGSGMGLDMVQRIVRQHQAEIRVESVPGRTQFMVCFSRNI